jgi:hypothetical protein
MKLFALSLFLPAFLSAQVLLTDNFNDSSIDSGKWTTQTPYGDSSIIEGSGYLQVQNRGRLTSVLDFTSPYIISGSIQLSNNQFSNAKIVIRSDDGSIGAAEMGGIAIQFQVREDGAVQNQLSIFTNGAPIESTASVSLNTTLNLDTWYSFEIRDLGSSVELYWNGSSTSTLILNSTYSVGSKIGFYNREGSAAGSGISANGMARLDSVTVTAVPEPATYAAIFGFMALGFVIFKRRK